MNDVYWASMARFDAPVFNEIEDVMKRIRKTYDDLPADDSQMFLHSLKALNLKAEILSRKKKYEESMLKGLQDNDTSKSSALIAVLQRVSALEDKIQPKRKPVQNLPSPQHKIAK